MTDNDEGEAGSDIPSLVEYPESLWESRLPVSEVMHVPPGHVGFNWRLVIEQLELSVSLLTLLGRGTRTRASFLNCVRSLWNIRFW